MSDRRSFKKIYSPFLLVTISSIPRHPHRDVMSAGQGLEHATSRDVVLLSAQPRSEQTIDLVVQQQTEGSVVVELVGSSLSAHRTTLSGSGGLASHRPPAPASHLVSQLGEIHACFAARQSCVYPDPLDGKRWLEVIRHFPLQRIRSGDSRSAFLAALVDDVDVRL